VKAARFHEYGNIEKLVVEDVPDPVAGPGTVVIKVGGCALNHLDVDLREGISRFPMELPHILGLEVAGEIVEVGPGVDSTWRVGDRVAPYLMGTDPHDHYSRTGRENLSPSGFVGVSMQGGYAEYIVVPERHLIRTPDGMTDVEAAAFQIAFGTSYHMLITRGRLALGETVLINSVGSGIGSAAVQIASLMGAVIIGTSSRDDTLAKATALGMHHGINYTKQDVAEQARALTDGRGVDLVYEHVGGAALQASLDAVTRDGRIVTCGAHAGEVVPFDVIPFFRNQTQLIGSFVFTSAEYEACLKLAGRGLLKPLVHAEVPLADIHQAFEMVESRSHFGKVVVVP
jgi:NADPH:quinone reductase-like Zn-dependent oxidoreductase